MKKFIIFCFCIFGLESFSFSISSLSNMSFEALFDHKKWSVTKESVKQKLKERLVPLYLFENQTIIGLDFSGLDLSYKDFTGCKLFKVDLKGVDLTQTEFRNTHFDQCNLVGAFFRYSVDELLGAPLNKVFKIKSNDPYELVKQYSDLMNEKERMEEKGLKEGARDVGKQAQCLNHLFGALYLPFDFKDLENFNLIDINLQNANLFYARLEGAQLSKDFKVPNYREPYNLFEAFKEAYSKNTPEKEEYLKLINSKFAIFKHISNEDLKKIIQKGLDITNVDLSDKDLSTLNLKGVDFTGVNLASSNLKDVILTGATFKNTHLYEAKLQGAWFSETFQLNYDQPSDLFEKWYDANTNNTSDKKYYNLLVNNSFNIFQGISKERLLTALQSKFDLANAYLGISHLEGVQLLGVDLETTYMYGSIFNDSIFTNVNLKNSNLSSCKFNHAKLNNVKFDLSNLYSSKFNQAKLKSVSFKGADLNNADFTDAVLEDVDFFAANIREIKLSKTVKLPYGKNEQDYVNFYHKCQDPKAKALLKIILESRDVKLDNRPLT